MPRAQESSAFFTPLRARRELPAETEVQAEVPRVELWAIARAARELHRRVVNGRWDAEAFRRAAGELELAMERVDPAVWRT